MVQLGQKCRDVVTGFEGLCMGKAQYLTGCNQVLLVPQRLSAEGKRLDGEWLDEQRVAVVGGEILELPGGGAVAAQHPGADEPQAPKR